MSTLNQVAAIQNTLIEHSVIIIDGLANTRIFCRCGWRTIELDRPDAEASRALHQAEHISETLNRISDDIVDAELD